MVFEQGTRGGSLKEADQNTVVEFNKTYHIEWNAKGFQSLFPGWEEQAYNDVLDKLSAKAAEIGGTVTLTYFKVDEISRTVTVEFYITQNVPTAYPVPALLYLAVIAVSIAVIAIVLYLEMLLIAEVVGGAFGDWGTIIGWAALGVIGLVGIYGVIKIVGAFTGGGGGGGRSVSGGAIRRAIREAIAEELG